MIALHGTYINDIPERMLHAAMAIRYRYFTMNYEFQFRPNTGRFYFR